MTDVNGSVSSAEDIQQPLVAEQPVIQTTDKDVEGLRQGIQAERERRQLAEQKAQLYEQMLQQQQMQSQQAQQPTYAPDDLITVGVADKMVEQKLNVYEQQKRNELFNLQVEIAKTKHEDYTEVIDCFNKMSQQDPSLLDTIQRAKNPVEMAYKLGKTDPEYQQKLIKKATEQVTQKINANLDKPPTLNTMSGMSPAFAAKDWSKATDAEIDAESRRIKGF